MWSHSERDVAASPLPYFYLVLLFLLLLWPLSCSIWILFTVFLLSTDFPWHRVWRKHLILRTSLAEKWKLEQRWWRTGRHRHQLERALQYIWKKRRKDPHPMSGDRKGGEVRGPGQTGQNIPTCFGWLGSSGGLSPCLLLPQSTILPLCLQSPTLHLFRCNSAQRREGKWRTFSEHRTCHQCKCPLKTVVCILLI